LFTSVLKWPGVADGRTVTPGHFKSLVRKSFVSLFPGVRVMDRVRVRF